MLFQKQRQRLCLLLTLVFSTKFVEVDAISGFQLARLKLPGIVFPDYNRWNLLGSETESKEGYFKRSLETQTSSSVGASSAVDLSKTLPVSSSRTILGAATPFQPLPIKGTGSRSLPQVQTKIAQFQSRSTAGGQSYLVSAVTRLPEKEFQAAAKPRTRRRAEQDTRKAVIPAKFAECLSTGAAIRLMPDGLNHGCVRRKARQTPFAPALGSTPTTVATPVAPALGSTPTASAMTPGGPALVSTPTTTMATPGSSTETSTPLIIKHPMPPEIYTGPATFLPPPTDEVVATTPPPSGNSPCSTGASPIPLGRPSFWEISKKGHGATQTVNKNDQRISTNKYYGRLRDRFYMQNDGNNLVFYFNEKEPTSELTMKVAEWDDEYVFAKGIMHWGAEDGRGSEHTVHGFRYPMEIEFVHYKKSLNSLEAALKVKNGVMIASVLYKYSGFDKDYMDPLISQSPIFRSPGPIKQVHGPLDMMELYPGTLEHYEYEGSMTTRPCVGGVRRIVFANPVGIGRDQLELLRLVVNFADGKKMVDNYRPLQDPSGRKVIFNPTLHQFNVTDVESLMVKDNTASHWRTLRQD